jgi:NADH:ubiquinone oxidoreductase subunit F (NADH-binding)
VNRLLAGGPATRLTGLTDREQLIAGVRAAGLLGRGGGWFPTADKLAAVVGGRRPVVLVNGCEGEPASLKDRTLLTVAPHLVLDGAVIVGHAVAAHEVVVCVHQGDPVYGVVNAALAARGDDPVRMRLIAVPGRYVASEESALVNLLNTGDAVPTSKPPRPVERGVRGRPTLVDNVETLAHLALIARHGADWFRSVGDPEVPGTMLVTVAGAGVREVSTGVSVGSLVGPDTGGAVLVGGYGGVWLPLPAMAGLALTPGAFRAAGTSLGVPMLVPLAPRACGLVETARLLAYLAGESAAQCGPCMFGLPAIAADFADLVAGRADAVRRLRRRLPVISGRGACAHPDGAVRLASSALTVFEADVQAHLCAAPCLATGLVTSR